MHTPSPRHRSTSGVRTRLVSEEDGFSTAELLANAALGVLALIAIWALLQALGVDIVEMIESQLTSGG